MRNRHRALGDDPGLFRRDIAIGARQANTIPRLLSRLAPIGMLVAPTPVRALLLCVEPPQFAVAAFAALLHQPVTVRAALGLVPCVVITAIPIVITTALRETGRQGKHGAQQKNRYDAFHVEYTPRQVFCKPATNRRGRASPHNASVPGLRHWVMPGLLFVAAHPDDETFLAAGTIAKYTAAGVPVELVCATRGQRGATADLCSIDELARVREAEVLEAARLLGISHVELLPYEDQKLASAPLDEIRRHIVSAVRRQRPEIVITFDPNGGNQHTDHIAISRFAADAVSAAADPKWHPETGAAHIIHRLLWSSPIPVFQLGETADLRQQAGIDFLMDIASFREKKEAALRAHRTQFPGLDKIFRKEGALSWEAFRIGWGARPIMVPADDLFAL
jgi:LmbE family N-acetylglucosaminyl deacetylase